MGETGIEPLASLVFGQPAVSPLLSLRQLGPEDHKFEKEKYLGGGGGPAV